MRITDIIRKKRDGGALTKEEIEFFVNGYVNGEIPDYQISALLMAIYLNDMNDEEIVNLTVAIQNSGDKVDLSAINGIKVDKHSTGGVGDKTTLVAAPIAAANGAKIAKMSGRGLGHTGGTVDKLKSIPGFNTAIDKKQFFDIVNKIGICVVEQSGNVCPADKKLYALRDVTGTVEKICLIASSIMSKKLASGADRILFDVKTGSGAFMKTLEDAEKLARTMISIGNNAGKKTKAIITNMDIPLGNAIGNTLEVIEAADTLKGNGSADLVEVGVEIAANMIYLADKGTLSQCREMAKESIRNGSAFSKFCEMVQAQGGDIKYIENTDNFQKAAYNFDVTSAFDGYVSHMDTEKVGLAAVLLGAGREKKEDDIDFNAGIYLHKKTGDKVSKGDVIASLYCEHEEYFEQAKEKLLESYSFSPTAPKKSKLIISSIE